ncbi:unnamed protein product, partial [Amoebophrya sp. A120]
KCPACNAQNAAGEFLCAACGKPHPNATEKHLKFMPKNQPNNQYQVDRRSNNGAAGAPSSSSSADLVGEMMNIKPLQVPGEQAIIGNSSKSNQQTPSKASSVVSSKKNNNKATNRDRPPPPPPRRRVQSEFNIDAQQTTGAASRERSPRRADDGGVGVGDGPHEDDINRG